jgi:hypothetical protein
MGVVWNGAEHRPYHTFVEDKLAILHTIMKYYGHGFSAHFDVVMVRFCFLRIPTDLSFIF